MRVIKDECLWGQAMAEEHVDLESLGENPTTPHTGANHSAAKRHHGPEERSRRRFQVRADAQVTRIDTPVVESEVVTLVDASADGILFATDRDYPVGTEVLVRFPYTSSTSPKQLGSVVRVEAVAGGCRRVAIVIE